MAGTSAGTLTVAVSRATSAVHSRVIAVFALPVLASPAGAVYEAIAGSIGRLAKGTEGRKFTIPDIAPHVRTAMTVLDGHQDADGGKGIGMTDAMDVALAAAFRTEVMFTSDRHFRMARPLTGHGAFRLLPDDL